MKTGMDPSIYAMTKQFFYSVKVQVKYYQNHIEKVKEMLGKKGVKEKIPLSTYFIGK